jgi:hypothetical protein
MFEVVDLVAVVLREHFEARPALTGDGLRVFGAQARRDAAAAEAVRRCAIKAASLFATASTAGFIHLARHCWA